MEPITHILAGACMSRAGLKSKTALSTVTMVIAAEIADVDLLYSLRGPVAGFQHYRGWDPLSGHSAFDGGTFPCASVGLLPAAR